MNGQTSRSAAIHRRKNGEARLAEANAAVKRWVDTEVEHYLYRCYDATGRLLYIGCTQDVEARMGVHRSSWQNPASAYLNLHMERYEPEGPFAGRLLARRAERAAIKAEAPSEPAPQPRPRTAARKEGLMTTVPELARDAGMAETTNAADPRLILAVDRVIAEYAASGMPFSANCIRDDLPVVAGPLIGARIKAASMRLPREIKPTGRQVRSTLRSTHAKPLTVWVGVGS